MNVPSRTADPHPPGPGTPAHGIKGSVFGQVTDDVRDLIGAGRVSKAAVDRWLLPEDLRALASRVVSSEWYPVEACVRMNRLLLAEAGGGSPEYLRECGRRSARALVASGRYPEMSEAERLAIARPRAAEERFEAFGSELRQLVGLSRTIFNFSTWTPLLDPDHPLRHLIEVSEAEDIPEVLCWRIEGFLNELARQRGEPGLWTWERAAPDVILFRMTRDP